MGLLTAADLVKTKNDRITAAKIAESKGFKLSKLDDYAKEGGLAALDFIGDTLSTPQREAGSLLSGDGLVDPYGKEAANYDPSNLIIKGPGRAHGLGGFAADVLLDPLNLAAGIKVFANIGMKAGMKTFEEFAKEAAQQATKGSSTKADFIAARASNPTGRANELGAKQFLDGQNTAAKMDLEKKYTDYTKDYLATNTPKKGFIRNIMVGNAAREAVRRGEAEAASNLGKPGLTTNVDRLKQAPEKADEAEAKVAAEQAELTRLKNAKKANEQANRNANSINKGTATGMTSKPATLNADDEFIELPAKQFTSGEARAATDSAIKKHGDAVPGQENFDSALNKKAIKYETRQLKDAWRASEAEKGYAKEQDQLFAAANKELQQESSQLARDAAAHQKETYNAGKVAGDASRRISNSISKDRNDLRRLDSTLNPDRALKDFIDKRPDIGLAEAKKASATLKDIARSERAAAEEQARALAGMNPGFKSVEEFAKEAAQQATKEVDNAGVSIGSKSSADALNYTPINMKKYMEYKRTYESVDPASLSTTTKRAVASNAGKQAKNVRASASQAARRQKDIDRLDNSIKKLKNELSNFKNASGTPAQQARKAQRQKIVEQSLEEAVGTRELLRALIKSEKGQLSKAGRKISGGQKQIVKESGKISKMAMQAGKSNQAIKQAAADEISKRLGRLSVLDPNNKSYVIRRTKKPKSSDKQIKEQENRLNKANKQALALRKEANTSTDKGALDINNRVDQAGKVASRELAAGEVGTALGLKVIGRKPIVFAATTNKNLVKNLNRASKIPVLGALGRGLNSSFNPSAGTDPRVYEASLLVTHAATSAIERDHGSIARFMTNLVASNKRIVSEIFTSLSDRAGINGADPENFLRNSKELAEDAIAKRKTTETMKQAPGGMSKKDLQEAEEIAIRMEEDSLIAEAAAKSWDTLNDEGKAAYIGIRKFYDDKRTEAEALGLLDKVPSRANYISLRQLTHDEVRQRRSATVPSTEASLMKERKVGAIPDNYDVFEWAKAYSRDFNRAVYGRELTRQLAYRFGETGDKIKGLGGDWVKSDSASKLLNQSIYFPKEIHDSMALLVDLGTDPNAENIIVRFGSDISSHWKAAAYSNNPGHFPIDTIGDTWNFLLDNGVGIIPHILKSISKSGPLHATEEFLRAIDSGAPLTDKIIYRGKEMTIGDLGKMKLKVGKNAYRVDELSFGYLDSGLRNSGAGAGDVGKASGTPKEQLLHSVEVKGKDVHVPRALHAYTSYWQRLGNRRDNFSKRLSFIAGLSFHEAKGLSANEAARASAKSVRRSLFDYSELTAFEKKVARNFIPFYTWTRKNVPYQLTKVLERPVLAMSPYKLQENLADPNEPDYNIPEYLRSKSLRIGQLPGPIASVLGQKKDQPFYFNPMLPTFDLGNFQNSKTGGTNFSQALGMLSPVVKLPLELLQSKPTSLATGQKIDGEYFGNNGGVPVLGNKGEYVLSNLFGQPGNVLEKSLDRNLVPSKRIMPAIGALSGIRGQIVDKNQTRGIYETNITADNDDIVKQLQDAGIVPSGEAIKALNKKRSEMKKLNKSLRPGRKPRKLLTASNLLKK